MGPRDRERRRSPPGRPGPGYNRCRVLRPHIPAPSTIFFPIDKLHRAGAQKNLSRLARGLDRDRFQPVVVCLQGGPEIEALAGRGRHVAEARFGLDRMVERYCLYEELLTP